MWYECKRKTKRKQWRSRYRVSDELWAKIKPLLPKPPPTPGPEGGWPEPTLGTGHGQSRSCKSPFRSNTLH